MLHCPYGTKFKIVCNLNPGRVKHNTDFAANSLRRQILPELGTDNTDAAVSAGSLTPDNAVEAALSLNLGLVDVCKALSEVELSLCLGFHSVDFHKSGVVLLSSLASLESKEVTGHVESANLSK